jgi:hypothetical protein
MTTGAEDAIRIPLFPDPAGGRQLRFHCRPAFIVHHRESIRPVQCRLATSLTLSVLPLALWRAWNFDALPIDEWIDSRPSWRGIRCRLFCIGMHFPSPDPDHPRILSVPVRIPQARRVRIPPYLLLGTEFLQRHKAEVRLSCGALRAEPPYTFPCGTIVIP